MRVVIWVTAVAIFLLSSCKMSMLPNEEKAKISENYVAQIENSMVMNVYTEAGVEVSDISIYKDIQEICRYLKINDGILFVENDEHNEQIRACISHFYRIEEGIDLGIHYHPVYVKPGIYDTYECQMYRFYYVCANCGATKTKTVHSALGQ